jgi:hypothetical protein
LELEEEEQREGGLSPYEARYTALRAFGNPTLIREHTRSVWSWNMLENLVRDLRIGVRTLFRSSGFAMIAILVMALGELRSDLELEEEEQRENGLPPEEAHYAARRALGNTTLIKEQTHEAWGWAAFERLRQEVRYGLRRLGRSPGFAVTAVLILASGRHV